MDRKKVLVPLKGPVDARTIMSALSLLGDDPASVTLMHVATIPLTAPLDVELPEENWLEGLAKELSSKGLKARAVLAEARDIAEAILEEAERGSYDLILVLRERKRRIGIPGRGTMGKLLRQVNRPMLIFPLGQEGAKSAETE